MKISRTLAVLCVVGATFATAALAQTSHTRKAAARDVSQLVRLMDRDKNGVVSKDEFMDFMSQTFDRLDINKSGTLEPNELRPMTQPNWPTNLYTQPGT